MPRTPSTIDATNDLTRIAVIEVQYRSIGEQLRDIAATQVKNQEHIAVQLEDVKRQMAALPEKYVSKSEMHELSGRVRRLEDELVRYPLRDIADQVKKNSSVLADGRSVLKVLAVIWTVMTFVGPFVADWLFRLWQASH